MVIDENRSAHEQAAGDLGSDDDRMPMLSERQWTGLAKLGEALADPEAPSVEELRQAWRTTVGATRAAETLSRFVREHLAAELTGVLAEATEVVDRHEPFAALGELLSTLDHLRRNGSLARVRDLSDTLAGLSEGLEADTLIAASIAGSRRSSLSQMSALSEAIDAAVETGTQGGDDQGGVLGLLKTLRDPGVQRALRMLARVPERLHEGRSGEMGA
jgi:uncharacterized protein YjgD (DUF1641 family)